MRGPVPGLVWHGRTTALLMILGTMKIVEWNGVSVVWIRLRRLLQEMQSHSAYGTHSVTECPVRDAQKNRFALRGAQKELSGGMRHAVRGVSFLSQGHRPPERGFFTDEAEPRVPAAGGPEALRGGRETDRPAAPG